VQFNNQKGCLNNSAKLTEDQVLEIRAATGRTHRELAYEYGVDQGTIGKITRRETWAHLRGLST